MSLPGCLKINQSEWKKQLGNFNTKETYNKKKFATTKATYSLRKLTKGLIIGPIDITELGPVGRGRSGDESESKSDESAHRFFWDKDTRQNTQISREITDSLQVVSCMS